MFIIELNLFLKEFTCPFEQIRDGCINEKVFTNKDVKLLIISYLCSELQAASMIAVDNPATSENIRDTSKVIYSLALTI